MADRGLGFGDGRSGDGGMGVAARITTASEDLRNPSGNTFHRGRLVDVARRQPARIQFEPHGALRNLCAVAGGWRGRKAVDGGRLENQQPAWGPDSQYITYYCAREGGVRTIPVSGGPAEAISESGDSPQWSPNGRELVVRRVLIGSPATFETNRPGSDSTLVLISRAGGAPQSLTSIDKPPFNPSSLHWMGDDRHVLMACQMPASRDMSLWVFDTKSRQAEQIYTGAFPLSAVMSPDGRYLYYTNLQANVPGIWRARVGPGWKPVGAEPVIPAPDFVPRELTIDANGSRLAFTHQGGESALWSVSVDPRTGEATGAPKPWFRDRSFPQP